MVASTTTLVSVVIPTWNERENIAPLLAAVRGALQQDQFEVLVVDDASADGTGAAVNEDARRHPNVRLLQRSGKMGLSSAVLDGTARAAGAVVVMMDADFSHDPSLLPLLLKHLGPTTDMVIGSRYVHGACVRGWPLHRRLGSLTCTQIARVAFRLRVRDPLSGFVVFRRHVLEQLPTRFSARGFKLLLEVLATEPSLRVREVPIAFVDRTRGTSKFGIGELREFTMLCYRLLRWRLQALRGLPQPVSMQR